MVNEISLYFTQFYNHINYFLSGLLINSLHFSLIKYFYD